MVFFHSLFPIKTVSFIWSGFLISENHQKQTFILMKKSVTIGLGYNFGHKSNKTKNAIT